MKIPLYIEFKNKRVLIVGGGDVGLRRTKKFLEAGARVVVYSLEFSGGFGDLDNVDLVRGDVKSVGELEDLISKSDIVVVALPTTDYNDTIVKLARKYKVLVNLANDSKNTEVVIPLEKNLNDVRIAVTTEGKSVYVAKEVIRRIVDCIDPEDIGRLSEVIAKIKSSIKERYKDPRRRMIVYQELFNDIEFNDLIAQRKYGSALKRAEELILRFK